MLVCTALAASVLGLGRIATAAGPDGAAASAHQGHTTAVPAVPSGDDPDGDGFIAADPPVTGVTPSHATPPPRYFHEFQANCAVTHARTLKAMVDHCIVGGLQCDARGYYQNHPEAGAALNPRYELP